MRPLLAVLLVGPFMAQADATIANVATPSIQHDLHASGPLLQLVIGGYLIAFAVLLITGARLGQRYGYRRVYLLGTAGFTLASVACGLAPGPVMLVLARVVQGFGAALMFPQTLTGIQLTFAGKDRLRAIGLYAIALSSGAVLGQLLGGVLISANVAGIQWRSIFLVNAPIGALVVAAGLRYLPRDGGGTVDERGAVADPAGVPARRLDLVGVAVLSIAVALVVVPLTLGRDAGWPAWTWLCLALSVPTMAGFLAVERRIAIRGGAPLVEVGVLARPAISWALVALMCATGTYYALLFTVAQYLQQGLGRGPAVSGLALVPWVAAFGLAGQLLRRLPARAARSAPLAGCLLLAATYVAIAGAALTGHASVPLLVAVFGFGGFGLGVNFSALIGHLTGAVPRRFAPDISGVSTTITQIGGAVAVAAFGSLYLGLAGHPTRGFGVTTATLAAVAVVAGLAAHRATRQSDRPAPAARPVPLSSSGAGRADV